MSVCCVHPPAAHPQVTHHLVSGEAVLWAKRNAGLLLFIPLSFIVYGADWSWVPALGPEGWGVLMFTGGPAFGHQSRLTLDRLGAGLQSAVAASSRPAGPLLPPP